MSETTQQPAGGAQPANQGNQGNQAAATIVGAAAATAGAGGQNGQAAPTGREWLPEAFRDSHVFKDIPDVAALAKSYDSAARMVGLDKAQVLRLPTDPAAPEWAEVYARLGRPEAPDGYKFPELPQPLAEGVEPAAREAFHKLGLSAAQAEGVMGMYAAQVQAVEAQRMERAAQLEGAVVADLKREWGAAYDDRIAAAGVAIQAMGAEALAPVLEARMPDGTRIGSHPVLVKALAEIGARLAEPGGLKGGSAGQHGGRRTPEQAQQEIRRLQGDRTFAAEFADRSHPNYPTHKQLWDTLHAEAYPSAA